jgi:dihydroxy-acid dehydratase
VSQRGTDRQGAALFGDPGPDGLLHRAFLRGAGLDAQAVRRRPVVGICTSWSELSPCNSGLRTVADAVKRGIEDSGGLGLEFPTISLSEPFVRPTSMLLRNLMSMDVEEMVASSPIDAVVLLSGCDKTVPAQLMGAVSADVPAIMVTAGPRPVSCWAGEPLTIDEVWPLIDERRLGRVSDAEWLDLEGALNIGPGTCNVLGTAITMAAVAEVLGFALPGSSLHGAGSAAHAVSAERAGREVAAVVERGIRPSALVTVPALRNAMRTICALGGSTNAVIHLVAIAGRVGIDLDTATLAKWASDTPLLTDVRPMGHGLLSDLEAAGGVPAVVEALGDLFDLDTPTALGGTWRDVLRADPALGGEVVSTRAEPFAARSLVVLAGSLAPDGAVVKVPREGAPERHRGRAVVFDGVADVNARIDDEELEVTADDVLILRGVGTRGAPGIPEVGHIPIPAKLAREGVHDMIRVTDARMSGTATGTVILHVSPESAVGGPLSLVRDGDEIEIDLRAGTIDLLVPAEELAARVPAAPPPPPPRGYAWLYDAHVLQPDRGCDFDFLTARGAEVSG